MFGAVMRIIEIGDTLKIYQRKKPSSVPIGRTQYFDAAGNANVEVQSDRVFGAVNYSNTDYGTEFPESISLNNRYVYGFDIYNGVMWRDAPNGLFPISGKFQSVDGGGDYKMETYFKDKAKALLVSGIEGVDVHTVWDERHQNLYVIFKDIVTSANNDAVVFHEPSNRWICFTDMDQTNEDGWNMPIELDYWIVKGFDGGIGYLFDEDTRFATFALHASASAITFPTKQDLSMELFTPDVSATCDAVMSKADISLTPIDPNIVITYVHIAVASMTWLYTESGYIEAQTTLVSCYPTRSYISTMPSWITITVGVGGPEVGLNDYVFDGDVLSIFPTEDNVMAAKVDDPLIIRNVGYTDSDTILLSQTAPAAEPTIIITEDGTNPSEVTLSVMVGSMSAGGVDVLVSFTITDTRAAIGAAVIVYWTATIGTGEIDSTGNNSVTNGQSNNFTITLTTAVSADQRVYIKLRGITGEDISGDTDVPSITMTANTPTVVISECTSSKTTFTFAYDEDSRAEAIAAGNQTIISVTSDTNQADIVRIPNWLTVWSETEGAALYEGGTVDDGDTLTIYPKATNYEYATMPPIGYDYITLASSSDSTLVATLYLIQAAYSVYPGGQVQLPAGVASIHSSSSDYLSIVSGSYAVWGISVSDQIGYYLKGVINTLIDYEDYFTLYYRADITRGGVTTTDSVGVIHNAQCSQDASNYIPVTGTITLASNTVAGDVVTLYFSIYNF